ncbi:50S ribosomal protein L15e [Candidatus Woesearchaeota archaeon]|nr:50S ribosomal protein L15e [Candidatus Woesearchaeota archaeon]
MSLYKHIREAWKRPKQSEFYKARLIAWRREPATVRVKKPTRLDRARSLGYKAKQGFVIVRQRLIRGGRQHPRRSTGGRRPKASSQVKNLEKSYRQVAEERASRKYRNCEVLNSYWLADDGKFVWHEVILVDRTNPHILADRGINWISLEKGRVFRGKTSAGIRSRGLRKKGKGAEKARPSKRANLNRRKKSLKK